MATPLVRLPVAVAEGVGGGVAEAVIHRDVLVLTAPAGELPNRPSS